MTEEQEKQESQETLVAFVAGLLIGGLLVWVFGGTPQDTKKDAEKTGDESAESTEAPAGDNNAEDKTADNSDADKKDDSRPAMVTGEGSVDVANQVAGKVVKLDSATFPTAEGWIGVRSFPNGQIGSILGVAEFSESQGLVPSEVELVVPTIAGRTYAVTFFKDDGDSEFNPAFDVQIDTEVATFVAE